MSAAAQGGGKENDNSLDFFWGIAIVVAAVLLIWYFGRDYISEFVYQVRLYEIIAINFFLDGWNKLANAVNLPIGVQNTQLTYLAEQIQSRSLDSSFSNVASASKLVGEYLRYPVAVLLAVFAFIVYNRNVTMKFKNIFDMKRLFAMEKNNWPQITPVIKLNLGKEDIEKGPWAMALTPMQFCKKNELLEPRKDPAQLTANLDRVKAHKILALQLGALWYGPEHAPIHVRALYAVFAASANQDGEAATKLLHQISRSSVSGKLNFTGADELLKKYRDTKLVRLCEQRHAYILTVMGSMIELGRTNGVLACSEFLWLKPLDRRLWYMLNTMGRQTAFAEVAGPFAHWAAERALGRPMQTPMIEEAVNGLEAALAETIYEPDEESA